MDKVEKLSMCRICLAENIRMYVVTDETLQEMFEKLTDIPFVTEDRRPMLACSFCCTKLQQCCQLQRKCLEAEELLAQMLNMEYEQKPVTNEQYSGFVGGLIITPIENISIVEEYQINIDAIKEEVLPEQYDVELKVEHLSEELLEANLNNRFPDVGITHHLASMSEDDKHSLEIDIEGDEEPKLSRHKEDWKLETTPETKIPKVYKRREKQIVAKMKKNEQSKSRRTQKGRKSASESTKIKQPFTVTNSKNSVVEKNKKNINDLKNNLHMGSPSNTKKIINSNEGNKNPLFKCEVCGDEFTRKSDLKRHSNRHKTTFKLYTCDLCQRSFNNKQSLNYHIQTHTSETPFKCILCERSFTNIASLKFHILTHTGEKPHKCDVCERRFATKVYLNNHLRTHTGEKPYNCNVCERTFRMKSTLINHVRSHTGEKPFKCDSCPRSFISSSYLTKHNRIHTGEKPFKCNVCQRSFTHKTSLKWHSQKCESN